MNSNTETERDSGVDRFVGGYMYDRSDSPRWGHIESVRDENGDVVFTTSPINAHAVPDKIRAKVLEDYDGGITIVEVDGDE